MDLDAIEAREKVATPGPWRPSATKPPAADSLKVWAPNPDGPAGFCDEKCVLVGNKYFAGQAEKDVAFAAHAREDVPALIAELRRLSERIAELERQRDNLQRCNNEYLERARAAEQELRRQRIPDRSCIDLVHGDGF